ncbi:MAG TPA: aldolase/citrate lyase family protein [Chloroflexia bacterium]|nr:aldolase/citrate lyase family protein [Chloroflexia bacterium]
MKENLLKVKLKNDEPVFGLLSPNYDPSLAEVLGHLGFDCYMVDCEHGAGGHMEVEHMVRACETVGVTPLARVRSADPKLLLQFMDTGLMGVMMPGIIDADDVKRLVEAVKYPPVGKRGIGPVRANDYLFGSMSQGEYVRFSNEQTLLLPQIETMEAVRNLDSLIKVEGIDGFIVGPRDLSMSMGFYDGPAHDEVSAVINDVFDVVLGAGLVVGTVAGTGEAARALVDRGARIILGSVNNLLRVGAASFFQAVR